jgi:hypothetical protein
MTVVVLLVLRSKGARVLLPFMVGARGGFLSSLTSNYEFFRRLTYFLGDSRWVGVTFPRHRLPVRGSRSEKFRVVSA